jgi:hypothetical protein
MVRQEIQDREIRIKPGGENKSGEEVSSPEVVIQLRLELRTPSLKGMCSTY